MRRYQVENKTYYMFFTKLARQALSKSIRKAQSPLRSETHHISLLPIHYNLLA